jgi:predicted DNA-binding transcriptional regulator AlpA
MSDTEKYLTARQVLARYNVSQMSLHRWLKNPDLAFPRPLYINRRRFFREADIIAWERRRAGKAA